MSQMEGNCILKGMAPYQLVLSHLGVSMLIYLCGLEMRFINMTSQKPLCVCFQGISPDIQTTTNILY